MIVAVALAVAVVAAVRGVWSPCGLSMLSALNPLAERARGHRFGVTAAWYAAGGVLGGALLGGCCALVAAGVGRLPLGGRTLLDHALDHLADEAVEIVAVNAHWQAEAVAAPDPSQVG